MNANTAEEIGARTTGSDGGIFQPGMTLRDYFAAKAMQGFYSCQNWEDVGFTVSTKGAPMQELVASNAYLMADAMLKERSK